VPTKVSPADIVSRGCTVEELTSSVRLAGSPFLLEPSCSWPVNKHFELSADVASLETCKSTVTLLIDPQVNSLVTKIEEFSSHNRLLRVFVWVFRLIHRCKKITGSYAKIVKSSEINFVFNKIVELRLHEFSHSIDKLKRRVTLSPKLQR